MARRTQELQEHLLLGELAQPTGHAPSLAVLDRLAQVYECDAADLLAGWGEHGGPGRGTRAADAAEPETMAWQVAHLDLHELTRALADWARRLPEQQRSALLLKLSTAAAVAADTSRPVAVRGVAPGPTELAGVWESRYRYLSTGRAVEIEGIHRIDLRVEHGRLTGRSEPTPTGSVELDLAANGLIMTGTWTERTTPDGYYHGAIYHGVVQLVLDPTGRTMTGSWLGPDNRFTINSGPWTLSRIC